MSQRVSEEVSAQIGGPPLDGVVYVHITEGSHQTTQDPLLGVLLFLQTLNVSFFVSLSLSSSRACSLSSPHEIAKRKQQVRGFEGPPQPAEGFMNEVTHTHTIA